MCISFLGMLVTLALWCACADAAVVGHGRSVRSCGAHAHFDAISNSCLPYNDVDKNFPALNQASNVRIAGDIAQIEGHRTFDSVEGFVRADNISERCRQHSVTPVTCGPDDTQDGLLPHPDDCGLFYYCVQPGQPPVCRDCPAGLHFNPAKHVCDEPADAGCLSTTPTSPATETPTAP